MVHWRIHPLCCHIRADDLHDRRVDSARITAIYPLNPTLTVKTHVARVSDGPTDPFGAAWATLPCRGTRFLFPSQRLPPHVPRSSHPHPLRAAVGDARNRPGIYRMLGSRGEVVYVGKS